MSRSSSLFLASTVLIGALLLVVFGISSLPPVEPAATNADAGTAAVAALDAPTVVFGNPTKGAAKAKVTIVVFGDYQCEPCAQIDDSLGKIIKDMPDDVRVVWKDFPNTAQHKEALTAAVAARCAGLQGAFWDYHDVLFANQASLSIGNYPIIASQLGLDPDGFGSCLKDMTTQPIVERDFEEGQRLRVDATPYLFINSRRVSGALKYEFLREIIASEITKVEKAQAGQKPAGSR